MIYFMAVTGVYLISVLLKLNGWVTLALVIYAFVWVHFLQKKLRLASFRANRFYETALYLDTVLYAFVKEGKVELAVRDAFQTLPEGELKEVVGRSHEHLMMTYDETPLLEESLSIISEAYPCKRICEVHKFMTHVEYYGGEIERPVSLLLTDKKRWEKRIREAMADRKKQFTDVCLSIAASLIICGVMSHLPVMNIDISRHGIIQVFAFLVVLADSIIAIRAMNYLCVDWISLRLGEEEGYYEKKMQEYQEYDERKEARYSALLGAAALVVSFVFFLFGQKLWCAIGLLISLVLWNQHRIGKGLMRKKLVQEISYAFPNWLLDLVLLLQSENVHVALRKSAEFVPEVLRGELHLLLERLEMEPESSKPYHVFLKDFSIPEICSAMGSLYSLSIGNSVNANRQIGELVEKNMELLDQTERKMLQEASAGMQILFLLPVLTASGKLMADMVMMMIEFMQMPML